MLLQFDKLVSWWTRPLAVSSITMLRLALGLLTFAYFGDAMTDVSFWFGQDGLHSSSRVAEFLQLADLQDAAAVSISPLFLLNDSWVYYVYCLIGMALSLSIAVGIGGRWITFATWLWVVFWANRLLWLSGLTETILSLTLFSTAFAPTSPLRIRRTKEDAELKNKVTPAAKLSLSKPSIATGVAIRVTAVQGSLIAAMTVASMLAGRVWWNATGSVALAAPESIRTISLVSWLRNPLLHEPISLIIICAVPVGLLLAWRSRSIGIRLLLVWSLLIAVLGSHWIYGGVLACSLYAIKPACDRPTTILH